MATLLYRLGRTAYRRWPAFVAVWIVVLVAVGITAVAISKPMNDAFSIPGIPSEQAQTLQTDLGLGGGASVDAASGTLVIAAPEGRRLSESAYSSAVDTMLVRLRQVPQIVSPDRLGNPVQVAAAQFEKAVAGAVHAGQPQAVAESNAKALLPLSADGRVGTVSFTFDAKSPGDVKASTRDAVTAVMDSGRASGLVVEASGSGLQGAVAVDGKSEALGLLVAGVVLILTFGSLVAAGLPLITAVVGVGIGFLGVTAATAFTDIGSTTPIIAVMLGLAVGIDYALFILSRYRTELDSTDDRQEAMGRAVGTAGSAVVFAGLTVLIALAALAVVRIPFLTAMGLAAAGTVFAAVLIALTLLPALLGMLKSKAFAGRVRDRSRGRHEAPPESSVATSADLPQDHGFAARPRTNNGVRWARLVARAPIVVVLLAVLGLGALAIPAKDLHLALPSDSTASSGTTQRRAADLQTAAFGAGRGGPLLLVVDARALPDAAGRGQAYGAVTQWAANRGDVANAQVIGTNQAGTGAQVLITPRSGPDDQATLDLLNGLRDGQRSIEEQTGTVLGVTGVTAIQSDVSQRLSEALPPYLAVVIGLAFVLLVLVFRSLLVPLTATLGFLLSLLATLGLTVLVFQKHLFGLVEPAPLVSFMPVLLIGIVFGLAMDYQVFLVTRMRESYVHRRDARGAVVDGFRHGARVVTAAAIIMISVFAAFIFQANALIQSMGFALAIAVFFDAFVVRMTLIPALMNVIGDAAWWLPAWLDKVIPHVDIEGTRLAHRRPESGSGGHAASRDREALPDLDSAAPA
ncbi:MMPL family transporter [Lapillicoccus sp.]|uniref:MMPL family transporter n=1 Tax=Lapillicoccus sp. TaxID=1909287 RepID=UPI0032653D35